MISSVLYLLSVAPVPEKSGERFRPLLQIWPPCQTKDANPQTPICNMAQTSDHHEYRKQKSSHAILAVLVKASAHLPV